MEDSGVDPIGDSCRGGHFGGIPCGGDRYIGCPGP